MENQRIADQVGYDESYERENFRKSGPYHITSIDWSSINDRKSVAASLVKGVYVLESDRHYNRVGSKALGPPWWNFFQFQLIDRLVDEEDKTYFGAIFEYKATPYQPSYPRYVLAFRGTVKRIPNLNRDLGLDARLALGRSLARDLRYQKAINALKKLVSIAPGPGSVWMAGHSLGAAIALQVGKEMAKEVRYIESYLFNPPFPSPPLVMLKNEIIKNTIRITKDILTAKVCRYFPQQCSAQHASFDAWCPWIPNLFVHQKDIISSGYIGYFDKRWLMESLGLGIVGKIATGSSVLGMVLGALGRDAEPSHLIPSANLTKNMLDLSLKEAHGIQQWWGQGCVFHSQLQQI